MIISARKKNQTRLNGYSSEYHAAWLTLCLLQLATVVSLIAEGEVSLTILLCTFSVYAAVWAGYMKGKEDNEKKP